MANETTQHKRPMGELRDAYHAETQLVKAPPKMAKAATPRGRSTAKAVAQGPVMAKASIAKSGRR